MNAPVHAGTAPPPEPPPTDLARGLAPAEAAAVLGIPAATARTRLHRARHQLRAHLERAGHHREVITDAH